jgi:oxygen-independent coproporphyrinogen-3 oxidase
MAHPCKVAHPLARSALHADFGVYVHWPFCARICPYCDFNVYRDRGVDAGRWAGALSRELEFWAERTPGRKLASLYFGGGTPALAPLAVVADVIDACARLWGFADDPEITIEANPTGADRARFSAFRTAGVNRLSLGVQSFDDAALKFLGRDHDAAAARAAIDVALAAFPSVSADFIYARPGQTVDQWTEELAAALATGLKHLSLYQLTVEPGTAFGLQIEKGRWSPADEDFAADLFDLTQEIAAAAGLPAYEISNHAAPEKKSRHNMIYWRQGDYVGVGPGAHGRLTVGGARRASETEKDPNRYLAIVEEKGVGAVVDEALTEDEAFIEKLAMGLRTTEGARLSGGEWARIGGPFAQLSEEGLLERRGERLFATANGRRLLNSVLAELLS